MTSHMGRVQFSRLRNERGTVLLMVYLVIAGLITFGAAFVFISTVDSRVAELQRRSTTAFYIAEAGIERALHTLRQDFLYDGNWSQVTVEGTTVGPDSSDFYTLPYASTELNGGSYEVQLKNVAGSSDAIWIRSTGIFGGAQKTIQVYARIDKTSAWHNVIFAGIGQSGAMINGNVDIRGSVHVLGTGLQPTDYVIDLGGTAELVGNNYGGLSAALRAKVPALPAVVFNGETVETLHSVLRVKRGIVGLSGAATAGEPNVAGNTVKETVDAVYTNDGFGGNQGVNNVHSDNGWSHAYDLGDSVVFPSLSDPHEGYATYQQYLYNNALVLSNADSLAEMANITPTSNFSFSSSSGSISIDGSGNLTISGIVYIDGGDLNIRRASPSNDTITYSGTGSIFVTGNVAVEAHFLTLGNNSFPNNVIGIMTPNNIALGTVSQRNIMGLFYAENRISIDKQSNILGTLVANYFDMGNQVPKIFQVPEVVNYLPPGLIGQAGTAWIEIVLWEEI